MTVIEQERVGHRVDHEGETHARIECPQRIDLRRLTKPKGRMASVVRVMPDDNDNRLPLPAVSIAQLLLRPYYATIRVDGVFGPQTRAAVMAFQVRTHRRVTGMLGQDDWAILCDRSTVTIGSRGNAVRAVQLLLNHRLPMGRQLVVDGVFGTGTSMTVKDAQRAAGLQPTGLVDRATYAALLHA